MSKLLYVASHLGFSEGGRDFMYGKLIPIIEAAGYRILDPWKLTPESLFDAARNLPDGPEKIKKFVEVNKVATDNNFYAIRRSDGLVAVLDGQDVDSGTSCEIGFAAALGKPILGYRGDFRLSSENSGAIVNMQVQGGIELHRGKIITKLDEMSVELKKLFG